ncbi:hypothetical protein VTH06DRAFT_2723 [Thermothelomyces fergusii]
MVASMPFSSPILVHHSLPVVAMAILVVWAASQMLVSHWRRAGPAGSVATNPSPATDLAVSGSQGPSELMTTSAAATRPIPIPARNTHPINPDSDPDIAGTVTAVFPWRFSPYSLDLLPQYCHPRCHRHPARPRLEAQFSAGAPGAGLLSNRYVDEHEGGSDDALFTRGESLSSSLSSSSSSSSAAATMWWGGGSPEGSGWGSYSQEMLLFGLGGQFEL